MLYEYRQLPTNTPWATMWSELSKRTGQPDCSPGVVGRKLTVNRSQLFSEVQLLRHLDQAAGPFKGQKLPFLATVAMISIDWQD
jgi:hypothetical protein